MFDVMTYYLNNGMRVMLHREQGTRVVKVGIVINQGSMHETDENNGISHFLEHMVYARTVDDEHIKKFQNDLYNYGATSYATTYKDSTMYYVSGLNDGIRIYLEFLRDLVFSKRSFANGTLVRERDVVTRELVSFYSSFNQINDRSIQALYGENNIGRIILGKKNNVANFDIEDFEKIYENSYVPGNAAIVVFGDIDYYELEQTINELYGTLKDVKSRQETQPVLNSPGIYHNSTYRGENSIISICHRMVTNNEPTLMENCVNVLLDAMCNPTLCQRTAYELRMKTGLAYKIGGFSKVTNSLYAIGTNAVAKNSDIPEVAKIIWDNYCNLREYGFSEEELERIKKNIIYQRLADKNNMSMQADVLLRMAMNPFIYSPENDIRVIENLSLEDVNIKLKEMLNVNNFGIAAIGNFDMNHVIKQFML